jgi:hypothetical protein
VRDLTSSLPSTLVAGPPGPTAVLPVSIVVPLRTAHPRLDLGERLAQMAAHVAEVIVVDGSDPSVQDAHRAARPPSIRLLPLDDDDRTPMGKVGAVLAGARTAGHDVIVIADDDVTWTRAQLERAHAVMANTDVAGLRPQNRYTALTWVGRWDTARSLIQRAVGGDWPGTYVVRRSALLDGGYRGDVMFENLELERTLRARGGTVVVDLGLVVDRDPPTARHFLGQRVRQAYDELARPAHLAVELAIVPVVVMGGRRAAGAVAVGSVVLAEAGRRRAGGREHFRPTSALWAPVWVAERAVTSWLALGSRLLLGGIRYRDGRLRDAASSLRDLRQQAAKKRRG